MPETQSDPTFLRLDRDGCELATSVLPASRCAQLAALIEALPDRGAGSRRLLEQPWCRDLAVELAAHPRIAPLLGGARSAVQCTLFRKSLRANWNVALHQDLAVPLRRRLDVPGWSGWSRKEGVDFAFAPPEVLATLLALRVHVDACGAENGALRVVPGSHRNGFVAPDGPAAYLCAAPAGSVLAMRPLLLHASSKASSPAPRRVLHFLYAPALLPHGLQWHDSVAG